MGTTITETVPKGWHPDAHRQWMRNERRAAVQSTLAKINTFGREKPVALVLQLTYYLFLLGDYRSATKVLRHQIKATPDHPEVVLNLAVCLSRLNDNEEAVKLAAAVLARDPDSIVMLDVQAKALHKLGRLEEARAAGTRSIEAKDRKAADPPRGWKLPAGKPARLARRKGKRDVIAFSLWGHDQRYLRGGLQNVLAAKEHYPDWSVRFYVDDSVPVDYVAALRELGAEVAVQPAGQALRQKLCWRFGVANDPGVGYFLVRDADSVVSAREAAAVAAWIESEKWFHVIRDWWTHTTTVLAGMWGGVSGVLPDLSAMLARYSSGLVETPNVDQWFLADQVWGCLRKSCLVHDRCFRPAGALPVPGPEPQGSQHIGQDEFAVRRAEQEALLRPWILRVPSLRRFA